MKITKVTIIDDSKENTVFEVEFLNFFRRKIKRKAYRLNPFDLCKWLDTDELIGGKSSALCTILDLKQQTFEL